MIRYILSLVLTAGTVLTYSQGTIQKSYLDIPLVDLNSDLSRQVIVDREEGQYLGHPTTVLLEDGKTILTVYPKGHGKGEIVYKRSTDGGLTWGERIPLPESWKTSLEVPTIFRVADPKGKKRLIVFSGLYPARLAHSEDDGKSWSELEKAGGWGGIVVMGAMAELKTGKGHYMALFHDDMRYFTANGQVLFNADVKSNKERLFTLYKTFSADGGLTWSEPEIILSRRDINLCEPGILRSPDGKKLAVLLRENSRRQNSQIIFSSDEGKTWSDPRPLPNELNGDRHVLKYGPDGRILVVFRDISPSSFRPDLDRMAKERNEVNISEVAKATGQGSPTEGDWVGWVGTWDDLVSGGKGEYRIRFKDNINSWDCCYPGVELLPDGTFVVTTYGHWDRDKQPYIVSVRFKLKELDNLVPPGSTGLKGEYYRLFVGGFTSDSKTGMSVFDFNSGTGELKPLSQTDVGANPSYFCYSNKNKLLYVLNEVMEFRGESGGGLTTLKYNPTDASFEKMNELLIPYGGPCYISLSHDSAYLFVANYTNGSVAVIRLGSDGIPETVSDTVIYYKTAPKPSHAHMIESDPSGKKVYVTDLGLDRIMVYDFDRNTGKLNLATNDTVSVTPGSGPRHFTFNSEGSKMYVINELGSKMMSFDVDARGGLKLLQTLPTFREGYKGKNYCADIHLSKDGRFLYGSNRGENTIVTFRIMDDGTLSLAGHTSCGGDWPRNFTLDPSGKFLLAGNQKSDSISVFRLNLKTGLPEEPARNYKVTAPACLKFF